MNELSLKLFQVRQLAAVLKPVLADRTAGVRAAALALSLTEVAQRLELPDKIALMHHLTQEIFGPESVESQLERYIKELKDAQEPEEKAAPPSGGIV